MENSKRIQRETPQYWSGFFLVLWIQSCKKCLVLLAPLGESCTVSSSVSPCFSTIQSFSELLILCHFLFLEFGLFYLPHSSNSPEHTAVASHPPSLPKELKQCLNAIFSIPSSSNNTRTQLLPPSPPSLPPSCLSLLYLWRGEQVSLFSHCLLTLYYCSKLSIKFSLLNPKLPWKTPSPFLSFPRTCC